MSDSRIVELSARIASNTAKVNSYLVAHNLPRPSFDIDAPVQSLIPNDEPDIAAARQAVIHDCLELRELMLGPKDHLISYRYNELISQHAILRFRLAEAFPIGGETTFAELAATTGLNETHVRKLLRHAMTQHIFHEPRPGVVAHTAASRVLVEDKGLYNWLRFSTDDLWHAAYHTGDAMAKYPGSEEPNETGFALSNQTDKDMYHFFSEHPERAERFAAAMRFFTERPGLEPHHVVDNYPWNEIREGGTIVDVGGSHGIICIELARRFKGLRFVVQDLDEPVIRDAERQRPAELADRVKYMVHDFFTEQPVHGADVYFLRAVLHNWSDKYAVNILRNLIPALKPGAKIILNETVIPEPKDVAPEQAPRLRANDMVMIELQNGDDREMGGWERLFAKAHPGFRFHGGKQPPGSALWILEAEWIGE
ncbi:S-adenosyl-L-methionine-dependent methyltransferase [Hypoxylon sp. FL1857]|nr:S-adenosyl-L-methionine-dependent methyltransferase [Hypoxylon sp. FL1857]